MIAFRTNAGQNVGIGHLTRCYRLALELFHRGYECHFYLDGKSEFLSEYLHPFSYSGLYESGAEFLDEKSDSIIFKNSMIDDLEGVVVDDYRLSKIWESSVASLEVPIMVLDDRNTAEHQCSVLVDGKWEGDLTQSRYLTNVNAECVRLLGPQYVFLDSLDGSKDRKCSIDLGNKFKIILSLGGGGDMNVLASLIKNIIRNEPKDTRYSLCPVIGPYATNQEVLIKLALEEDCISPILNARTLLGHLKDADLYVGAAGGTLYETLLLQVPSITFSLSENQNNNRSYLEDLGHYFHLGEISEESHEKIANLAWTILQSHKRVKILYGGPKKITLDTFGAQRAASVFESHINKRPSIYFGDTIFAPHLNKLKAVRHDSSHEFILVDDSHVNKYVDSRNLEINLQNMTETQAVMHLDHYIWWFKSKRISYILKKSDMPLLYIWHQTRIIDGVTVLVGGWFVCTSECGPMDAMYALDQQLQITDKDFPGIPWVAVIKKTNKYVETLSKRMSFNGLRKEDQMYWIAQLCFPSATEDQFNYYFRVSKSTV